MPGIGSEHGTVVTSRTGALRQVINRALFASAWRLPLSALVVVIGIGWLGESSAARAWDRQSTALHREAVDLAARAAAVLEGRINALRLITEPIAIDPVVRAALVTKDASAIPRVLSEVSARLPDGVRGSSGGSGGAGAVNAWYVADADGAPFGIVTAPVTGQDSTRMGVGVDVRIDERAFAELARRARSSASTSVSTMQAGSFAGGAPAVVLMSSIAGALSPFVGAFVLETAANRTVAVLAPHVPDVADAYAIDERGTMVGRARDPFDYRVSPRLPEVGRQSTDVVDPIAGARRIVAQRAVPGTEWRVVAAIDPAPAEAELAGTLSVERAIRLALLFLLMVGATILGRVGRQNLQLLTQVDDDSRQLTAASRHKSEFLANMSHELRTPLNAVIGFSEVLEQRLFGELNDKQAEYVRDIASSGKHLLDLVNEILDLSKVEAGRMELERSEFSAADAILATFAFVRERAGRHGIELSVDVPADLGTLVADERKVRQVLLNLLSNAVKFTPDGGWIGVTARRADGEIQVSVRDTGIGIAPADQATVFEEFRQVGKASDRSREGTGLGLTLAKRFVELHGGRIWFESELGKGTTFTFALPVVPERENARA